MEVSVHSNRRRKGDGSNDKSNAQPPVKSVRREADGSTSRCQSDVIDVNDDEADRQSVVSNVKREGEQPGRSAEVQLRQELIMVKRHSLDLEQHLLNMEQQLAVKDGMLQRERRATREAELRADRVEKQLESQGALHESEKSELEKQVSELTDKLAKKDERIEELKRNLAEYEAIDCEVEKPSDVVRTSPVISTTAHPNNILLLLTPTAHHSISIDEGVTRVRASLKNCGKEEKRRCENNASTFDCDVCGINKPNKLAVTKHFLSKEHIEKVRAHGVAVSKAAVDNWTNMLELHEKQALGLL